MQELKTKKLFYGKWPYKIEIYVKGASRVHYSGPTTTLEWCLGKKQVSYWDNEYGFWGARHSAGIDKVELGKFAIAVTPFLEMKDTLKIRCEGGHLNFFTDSKDIVDQLKQALYPWIQAITAPGSDEELAFLLDNGRRKSICNRLPHSKYKFRVYLNTNFESTQRESFYQWLLKYDDKVDFPGSTERWLTSVIYYTQDPFVYVENEKMLSMMLLYLGNHTKRVEEFILRDSINT